MEEKKKDRLLKLIIIAIAALIGIGAIVLLVQAVQAIFFPVLGVAVVIWFVFGDRIAANWRANKQRQALEQQQRAAQAEGMYYNILRNMVKPVVDEMIGKSVSEGLLVYRGEALYGTEWFYFRWPVEIYAAPDENALKEKIERRLSQETGIRYREVRRQGCVSISPGHDGEILILVKLPVWTKIM